MDQQLLGLFRHLVLLVAMFRVGDSGKAMLGTTDGMLDGFTDVSLHIRIFGLLESRWLRGCRLQLERQIRFVLVGCRHCWPQSPPFHHPERHQHLGWGLEQGLGLE